MRIVSKNLWAQHEGALGDGGTITYLVVYTFVRLIKVLLGFGR